MFSVQMLLWYGVRPLVKKSFQQFCISTGLVENANFQNYDIQNTEDRIQAPHTKLYHQNWLNAATASRNDGAWIKEIFPKKIVGKNSHKENQIPGSHSSRTWSGLPRIFSNIRFLFEFQLPAGFKSFKKDYRIQPNYEEQKHSFEQPNTSLQLYDQNFIETIKPHLAGIETGVQTKDDILQFIEASSSDPFVLSMAKFKAVFGEQWPPRASFQDWPERWEPYKEMAEEMSYKMRDLPSPGHFRVWILEKCSEIDILEVKQQLQDKWALSAHSSAAYGLMGALAKLLFSFRWGKLPVTQEELDRKTLTFPPALMEIFEMISKHYGTMPRGSMFSTSFANAVYEKDSDGPRGTSCFFTTEEDMRQTETNFFSSFAHVDEKFAKALPFMNRYMALTDFAHKGGTEVAKLLLDKRVECLTEILHHVREMFKTFWEYIKEQKVKSKIWAPYIQAATAWNINGQTEGMSGAEIFGFNLLDTFLGVKGDSAVFKASLKKLLTIPKVCREVILSISNEDHDRFDSFLGLEDDPVLKVKEEILSALYTWRLGHIKVPARYFNKDFKTTSGGVVEMNHDDESTSLVEETEKQLRLRAIETKACMGSKPRSKPSAG